MILTHLVSFTVVVVTQLVFFVVHAFSVGEQKNLIKYLGLGMLVGLPFGVVFDLVVGHYLGVFTYELGFVWWFLVINGIFSYGFMMANVFLLHGHSALHMYGWSAGLAAVYEVTNYFLPVWEWTFLSSNTLEILTVVLAAYFGLAWIMMLVLRFLFGTKFKIVPF